MSEPYLPLRCSTPIPFYQDNYDEIIQCVDCSNEESDDFDESFGDSGEDQVKLEMLRIQQQHHISDACVADICQLLRKIAPLNVSIPSAYSIVKYRKQVANYNIFQYQSDEYFIMVMDEQINFFMQKPGNIWQKSVFTDLQIGSKFKENDKPFLLQLIMFIDGAPLVKSSTKKSFWVCLFTVANLKSADRYCFSNMLLGGIWFGSKPDWNYFLPPIINQLQKLYVNESYTIKCKVIGLVADLPARASVLNMRQFNGYFGCTFCEMQGNHVANRHVYPYEQEATAILRTNSEYLMSLSGVQTTRKPIKGVLGESLMSNIISIPSDVCIDYMHQILLGIVRSTVISIYESHIVCKEVLIEISTEILKFLTPHDFYRQPRGLIELKSWKATEWKRFLLYYGPFVFRHLPRRYYEHFLLLSVGVALMSRQVICDDDIRISTELFRIYRQKMFHLYGELSLTNNVHSLLHLTQQVEKYGPLWTTSSFPFEGAIHNLKRFCCGTRSLVPQMIEKFLSSKRLQPSTRKTNIKPISLLLVMEKFPFAISIIDSTISECYDRYEHKGSLYHSKLYERGRSRSSMWVSFIRESGEKQFGKVSFFFKTSSCSTVEAAITPLTNLVPVFDSALTDLPLAYSEALQTFHFRGELMDSLTVVSINSFISRCCVLPTTGSNVIYIVAINKDFEHD